MRLNLPNLLTLLRLGLIPFLVIAFYVPFQWHYQVAAATFALACLTDLLDGYVARRFRQITGFGEFLDPVADKLLIACALLLLLEKNPDFWFTLPALRLVGREIAVSALRERMAQLRQSTQVAVSAWGKSKTTIQMIAIIFLLAAATPEGNLWPLHWLLWPGYVLLYIAVLLTLHSMFLYLRAAWIHLHSSEEMQAEGAGDLPPQGVADFVPPKELP